VGGYLGISAPKKIGLYKIKKGRPARSNRVGERLTMGGKRGIVDMAINALLLFFSFLSLTRKKN
jgi:hypothetical protein